MMSSFGEIQAGLEKIKDHINSQNQSIKEGNEQAEEGYKKLRTIHDHLMQALQVARELGEFNKAADTIKAGADEHLVGIKETAAEIGLDGMNQEPAQTLIAAIGNLTLQSDGAMMGFRRAHGKLTLDAEGDIALPKAIYNAMQNGENVEGEYTSGAWDAAEFRETAAIAQAAVDRFRL
jgi:uncharacterized phage infection (PIP) family protein YhgE